MELIFQLFLTLPPILALDFQYFQNYGVAIEELKTDMTLIQQTLEEEITLVLTTPTLTLDHDLPQACNELVQNKTTSRDRFNNLVQNLLIARFQNNFVARRGDITDIQTFSARQDAELAAINALETTTKVYGTIELAVENFIASKNNVQIEDWKLVSPHSVTDSDGEEIDISGMTDNLYTRGFALSELCKPTDTEYRFEGLINAVPLVHIIFSKAPLSQLPENTSRVFRTYIKYENTRNETVREDCSDVNAATFRYQVAEGPKAGDTEEGAILSIRCPSQKGKPDRKGYLTFGIKIRLREDSVFCSIALKEITTQAKSAPWYGSSERKRRRRGARGDEELPRESRAVVAAAILAGAVAGATAGSAGAATYAHYSRKGMAEDIIRLDNAVRAGNLKDNEFHELLAETTDQIVVQMDSSSRAMRLMHDNQCLITRKLDKLVEIEMAEAMAASFADRVIYLATEIQANFPSNDAQKTVIDLCTGMNRKVEDAERLCTHFYQSGKNIELLFIQTQRRYNMVQISFRLQIAKPIFFRTPAKTFKVTSVPTPLMESKDGLFRYQQLNELPKHFVHLSEINQTLPTDQDCKSSGEIFFCEQSILNRIYSEKASCIEAIRTNGNLNACQPSTVVAVSDCIINVQPSYVMLSTAKVVTFMPHVKEEVSIHHLNRHETKFQGPGSYLLTRENLTADGYLMCETSKTFINSDRLQKNPVEIKMTDQKDGAVEHAILSEYSIIQSLADTFGKNRQQLEEEIAKLGNNEPERKRLLEVWKNRLNTPFPLPFLENKRQLITNTVIPLSTLILSGLVAICIILVLATLGKKFITIAWNRLKECSWSKEPEAPKEAVFNPATLLRNRRTVEI